MSRPIELGPFVLLDPIGSGAMGTVYHAVHGDSGGRVAVKVLRPEAAADRLARDNLEAEVRAVALLDHPHIVRIYDVGRVSAAEASRADERLVAGTPWFAMELAEQGSFKRRMRGLDGAELCDILVQLLTGLAHAHARGILHLDLKPANVMFGGRAHGALLTDFGMGVVGDPDPTGDFVRGTPHFMAPEQVRGRWEELGPWTDLYALGNLAWVAATGRPAMPDGTPHEILFAQLSFHPQTFEPVLEVPAGFEGWVRRLLHKDPDRRFAFAADALAALLEVRGEEPPPRIPDDWRISELEGAAEVSETTGMGLAVLRKPPIVGRTKERSALWQALRESAAGEARVVVLRGPAGAGKSRLGQWLGLRAHELGAGVPLATRHDEAGNGGLREALRRVFPVDLRDWDSEPGLGTRLQERGLSGPVARDVAAWLARGVTDPRSPGGPEPWWERAAEALEAVAADRLPIVFVDDVHFGAPTLRFVRWALASGRLVPSVVILAAEDEALLVHVDADELLQAIEALPGCVSLSLGPLSESARAALARRMLPLDPSLASEVAEKTAGSPVYTVEMLHDLAERGVLERGPLGLRLREGEQLSSPSHLASLWEGHLERVLAGHPDWPRSFEVAAVLGPRLVSDQWSDACARLSRPAPPELLAELVEARLARPTPHGLRFVHPMMCDAIAEKVEDPAVHRACAEVLEGRDDARCAAAWFRADEHERALEAWLRAARRLRRGEPGRLEALVPRIREAADEVLTPGDPRWIAVHDLDVRLALDRGRPSEAGAAAARLWEVASDEASQLLAQLAMGRASLDLLDQRGALRHVRAAAELLEREPDLRAETADELVGVAIELGQVRDAEKWLAWSADAPSAQLSRGWIALARGQAGTAADLAHPLGAVNAGDRFTRARAALCEGYACLASGRVQDALAAWQAARRRFRALGHAAEGVASLGLAVALDALGQEDDALHVLDGLNAHAAGPRQAMRRALGEVAVRISRANDVTWNSWWRAVRQALEGAVALDPGDAVVLRFAVGRAARADRARELAEILRRLEPRA